MGLSGHVVSLMTKLPSIFLVHPGLPGAPSPTPFFIAPTWPRSPLQAGLSSSFACQTSSSRVFQTPQVHTPKTKLSNYLLTPPPVTLASLVQCGHPCILTGPVPWSLPLHPLMAASDPNLPSDHCFSPGNSSPGSPAPPWFPYYSPCAQPANLSMPLPHQKPFKGPLCPPGKFLPC